MWRYAILVFPVVGVYFLGRADGYRECAQHENARRRDAAVQALRATRRRDDF